MAKKEKYKKLQVEFLFELDLPSDIYYAMEKRDRDRLEDLNRLNARWKAYEKEKFVFFIGDFHKIADVVERYNCRLVFPKRSEVKKFGITYSGDSIDIKTDQNDFVIKQRFADGRVHTHVIPKKRVWRVYYVIRDYFKNHPDEEKVETPILWELFCKEFNLSRFFTALGYFKKDRFFGDRRTYHTFAYFPLKVLQHIGKIKYEGKYVYNPFMKTSVVEEGSEEDVSVDL